MLLTVGVSDTVKGTPLLAAPPTVTTTLPDVAARGAGTTIVVVLQLVGVAAIPLNVTVFEPCVDPKFAPEIVTDVPGTPLLGDVLVMDGAGIWTANVLETLSNVAVPSEVVFPLSTPRPTNTFCAILIV